MEMMEASIADMARMLEGSARGRFEPAALEVEITLVHTVASVLADDAFELRLGSYETLDDPWFLDDDGLPELITDDAYQTARLHALRPGALCYGLDT